jgi:hypothetical protein
MPHDGHVLAHVRAAANAAVGAGARAFEPEARHFLEVLTRVPNHPPGEVSDADVAALLGLVDAVVDAIEDRIAAARDSGAVQQQLAQLVYAIRAAMEEVDRWHRHYR